MIKSVRFAVAGIAMIFLMAACQKDAPEEDAGPAVFTAVIGDVFTRANFTENGNKLKGARNINDVIIIKSDGAAALSGRFLTASKGESSVLVSSGANPGINAPYLAYYPENVADGILPDTRQFSPDGPREVPMVARSSNKLLNFEPICGLLEFKLSTALDGVAVKSLEITADRPLSGKFTLDGDSNAVLSGSGGISLDCGNGVALGKSPATFWVSVPQGEYSSIEILMSATDGRSQTFSLSGGTKVKVLRGRITTCPIELLSVITEESGVATLPGGQEFNIAIKSLAHPELPENEFEPAVKDSTIVKLHFVLGDPSASGVRLGTSEMPVYASFNAGTGIMTVSTPAATLRTSPDCSGMFRYMTALEDVNVEVLDTDGLIDMSHMFSHCHNLKSLNLSRISSVNLCDMDNCFSDCWALASIDFTGFNTENVTTFRSLFNRCYSLSRLDLSSFRTTKIRTLGYCFHRCRSLQELIVTSFDLTNVSTLSYCFFELPSLAVVRTGDKFYPASGSTPSSFFGSNSSAQANRTGNTAGGITFYTNQAAADWLAKTNLRWIKSGYKNMTPIPVRFIDNITGEELSVTWAKN